MIVLVCGGRNFHEKQLFNRFMDNYHWDNDITKIVHGNCPTGADQMADQWAAVNRIPSQAYNADWEKHGKAGGAIRNRQMLDEETPDVVIAFPGNVGTADMVKYARSKGVEVIEVFDE